jgi:hypothetical protein
MEWLASGREYPTIQQSFEKHPCRFQINCLEAFGKAIVDGLKNLGCTGLIILPDP